jgi:CrcB protein
MFDMNHALVSAGIVALGALIGAPARYFVSGLVARRTGETFPWGTMVVNISGSLAIGMCGAFATIHGLSNASSFWLLAVTGVLGSYTTVSSFALQTRALIRDNQPASALANAGLSLSLCIIAALLGFALVSMLSPGAPR